MATLLVLYKTPADPAAFDAYCFETHIPIAKKIPGLGKYTASRNPVATPGGPMPVHLVAELYFDDLAAIGAAFASPEGQAAGADMANFVTDGAEMLALDTREV